MRQELKNIEYIERYLEDNLSILDRRKFEQLMREDDNFKADVDLQRQIVSQLKEEAFLADVSAYHQEFLKQEKSGIPKYFWLALFPIVLLSICFGVWYVYQDSTQADQPQPVISEVMESNMVDEIEDNTPTVEPVKTSVVEARQKAFETKFVTKKVSARNGASIQLKGSSSVLHIPENAVVDTDGNPVSGSFDLQYRELRDQAQMAFSKLPMRYQEGDDSYNFNSAGIFEIRAFKDDEALQIASNKSLTLDYEVTKRMRDLELYQLDEEDQTWFNTDKKVQLPQRGAYTESLDSVAYQRALEEYEEKTKKPEKTTPTRTGEHWDAGKITMMPEKITKIETIEKPDPNKYLVKHFTNPKVVKELRLNSFGVYNCSQRYQVQNQVAIDALYTNDQKSAIENANLLSIIDINYNAAYSFKPDQFICNAKANNVFLLWSKEGKLYSFVKRSTVELETGKYSFEMQDISTSVQNTKDLRQYLKFVKKKTQKTTD